MLTHKTINAMKENTLAFPVSVFIDECDLHLGPFYLVRTASIKTHLW